MPTELEKMLGIQEGMSGPGFQPMQAANLAQMGITDPYVMQFNIPRYDQPIQPFGAMQMPAYGYQLQQEGLLGGNGTQQQTGLLDTNTLQQQLVDLGALVENPAMRSPIASKIDWESPYSKSLFGNQYITPFDLYQRQNYGPGSSGYGG